MNNSNETVSKQIMHLANHFKRRRELYGIEDPKSYLDTPYYLRCGDEERDALMIHALLLQPIFCPTKCKDPIIKDEDYLMEPFMIADIVQHKCHECGESIHTRFKYKKSELEEKISRGDSLRFV